MKQFFVIEGLDGSGKSTQIKLLQEYFENYNIKSKFLHFPRTDSPIFGELIARFLRGDLGKIEEVNPYIVALLYAGDRFDAKNILQKWLEENYIIVLDRYIHSNIAYQCAKVDNLKEKLELRNWIYKMEYDYFKIPDPEISIFLDVPLSFINVQLNSKRSGNDRDYLNGKTDIHERNIKFQEKVRETFLWEASLNKKICILKCYDEKNNKILSKDYIFQKILNLLK